MSCYYMYALKPHGTMVTKNDIIDFVEIVTTSKKFLKDFEYPKEEVAFFWDHDDESTMRWLCGLQSNCSIYITPTRRLEQFQEEGCTYIVRIFHADSVLDPDVMNKDGSINLYELYEEEPETIMYICPDFTKYETHNQQFSNLSGLLVESAYYMLQNWDCYSKHFTMVKGLQSDIKQDPDALYNSLKLHVELLSQLLEKNMRDNNIIHRSKFVFVQKQQIFQDTSEPLGTALGKNSMTEVTKQFPICMDPSCWCYGCSMMRERNNQVEKTAEEEENTETKLPPYWCSYCLCKHEPTTVTLKKRAFQEDKYWTQADFEAAAFESATILRTAFERQHEKILNEM